MERLVLCTPSASWRRGILRGPSGFQESILDASEPPCFLRRLGDLAIASLLSLSFLRDGRRRTPPLGTLPCSPQSGVEQSLRAARGKGLGSSRRGECRLWRRRTRRARSCWSVALGEAVTVLRTVQLSLCGRGHVEQIGSVGPHVSRGSLPPVFIVECCAAPGSQLSNSGAVSCLFPVRVTALPSARTVSA